MNTDSQLIIGWRGTELTAEDGFDKDDVLQDAKFFTVPVEWAAKGTCSDQSRTSSNQDVATPAGQGNSTANQRSNNDRIRAHQGFYQQYNSVRDDLWKIVNIRLSEFRDTQEIFITGHSMGGALTILCALDLAFNYEMLQATTTYRIKAYPIASPRTGNQAFFNEFQKCNIHCDRLVLDNDAVTKVPLASMGYKHVGRKIKLYNSKDMGLLSKMNPTRIHHYSNYLKAILTTHQKITSQLANSSSNTETDNQ